MTPIDILQERAVSNPPAGSIRLINDAGALKTLDPNGTRKTMDVEETHPAAPVNYVAATAMTATYTADTDKTIVLTARDLGVRDPAPSLDMVDPLANDATLALTESAATGVVTISLATGVAGAITTTLQDIQDALAASILLSGVIGVGDGATVVTDSTTTLTGGSNAVLGTPAKLGRIATDGTDVWTALKEDPTTTQDGWVKTFTATP